MLREDARRRRPAAAGGTALLALVFAGWLGLAAGGTPTAAETAPPGTIPAGAVRFAIVPALSTVTYRVGETLVTGNRYNLAVGTTHAVRGDVYVDRAHLQNSRIGVVTVDISTFQSDKPRRDDAIRHDWLESSRYPTAVFTPTAVRGLPVAYVDGQDVSVQILGNLQVRGVTRPVTFSGTVKLSGSTLSGMLQASVLMTDFGFDPPSILGILKAENQARLELDFTAEPPQS
ncbi:MAG TPA: YceI family protein [bacterium]|nr:YceI family protein [bacterium]